MHKIAVPPLLRSDKKVQSIQVSGKFKGASPVLDYNFLYNILQNNIVIVFFYILDK